VLGAALALDRHRYCAGDVVHACPSESGHNIAFACLPTHGVLVVKRWLDVGLPNLLQGSRDAELQRSATGLEPPENRTVEIAHSDNRRSVASGASVPNGSDQIIYPGLIELGIRAINDAPFLDAAQKKAILHDNAARFLRLN